MIWFLAYYLLELVTRQKASYFGLETNQKGVMLDWVMFDVICYL